MTLHLLCINSDTLRFSPYLCSTRFTPNYLVGYITLFIFNSNCHARLEYISSSVALSGGCFTKYENAFLRISRLKNHKLCRQSHFASIYTDQTTEFK